MKFRCSDLFQLSACKGIALLGGKTGLDREIRWYYIADAMENLIATADWLIGNELILITGCNITDDPAETICAYIHACMEKNIAGIAINTGRYIPHVPPEVVALSDALGLPLFELPWETHFVEFTKELGTRIIDMAAIDDSERHFVEMLLFGNVSAVGGHSPLLAKFGFPPDEGYRIALLTVQPQKGAWHEEQRAHVCSYLSDTIRQLLDASGIRVITTRLGDYVLVFFSQTVPVRTVAGRLEAAIALLAARYPDALVFAGVGRPCAGLSEVCTSYYSAQQILDILPYEAECSRVLLYEDVGIYSLLFDVSDLSTMQTYHSELFSVLMEYDRANRAELMRTLETYLSENARLKPTARRLFIHENTLKYRLKKIEDLMGVDLHALSDQTRILLGFMIGRRLSLDGARSARKGAPPAPEERS